ncbi:hypothetical protein D3C78_593980 [compost metagenome]
MAQPLFQAATQQRAIETEPLLRQHHHLAGQQPVDGGQLRLIQLPLQMLIQIAGETGQLSVRAVQFLLCPAALTANLLRTAALRLRHQRHLPLVISPGRRLRLLQPLTPVDQREALLQLCLAPILGLQPCFTVPAPLPLDCPLLLLALQTLLGLLDLLACQSQFGRLALIVGLPVEQCLIDQRTEETQLAPQLQTLLMQPFELVNTLALVQSRQVLRAVGVDVGEGLVPLLLEVDLGVR